MALKSKTLNGSAFSAPISVEVDLIDTGDTKLPLQSPLQQAGVTTDVSLGPVMILVPRAHFLPSPARMLPHLVAVGLHPILNDSFIHFAHAGLANQKSFSTNKFSLVSSFPWLSLSPFILSNSLHKT